MCNEPPEVGTACLTMFAETTKSPMEDMWANFEGIMYELILRFHENPKNVLECLNFILDAEKNPNEHLSWEQKIVREKENVSKANYLCFHHIISDCIVLFVFRPTQ